MNSFEEMTAQDLWALRQEIVLGSIYIADYVNSYRWDAEDISDFFDGYIGFLQKTAEDLGGEWADYDDEGYLWCWFYCYDDLSWIGKEEEEEDLPWWEY